MKSAKPKSKKARDVVKPGEYYQDCALHPCLCIRAIRDEVAGISLIDGSYPRGCDINCCGVVKLTFQQAMMLKFYGPSNVEDRKRIPREKRWWAESLFGQIQYFPLPKEFRTSASGKARTEK